MVWCRLKVRGDTGSAFPRNQISLWTLESWRTDSYKKAKPQQKETSYKNVFVQPAQPTKPLPTVWLGDLMLYHHILKPEVSSSKNEFILSLTADKLNELWFKYVLLCHYDWRLLLRPTVILVFFTTQTSRSFISMKKKKDMKRKGFTVANFPKVHSQGNTTFFNMTLHSSSTALHF